MKTAEIALTIAILTLPALPKSSAALNDQKPKIVVPHVESPPEIENFLTMHPAGKIEKQMAKIEGFIQRTPKDGEPSPQHTEVYLCYDDENLYVVFVAFDSEPDKVRARMNRRENVFRDDIVEIMLDTFNDQRRAFAFLTNPLGVQWDALWTEGSGFDESFDTLWYSDGRLTDQGYVVWMSIPFKSLRFSASDKQTWGVVFVREIQRGQAEQSFWPRVSSRIEGRLNQAATLIINDKISPGRNMQFIPYGTYRTFRLLDRQNPQGPRFNTNTADPDAGLDAKFVVKDNMAVDVTLNPDFNQVESDQPQVTVNQRFEVFFPEKRPFFLENANFFRSPFNLVFTRRIADPQFGVRLTGKTGPYALGFMLMDDEAPGKRVPTGDPLHDRRAVFGIARISRDIFQQSNIGLIYTDREFEGSYNRVGGADGRIKFNQNWTTGFQGVFSTSKPLEGSSRTGSAFSLQVDRSGRQLNTHTHYQEISPDFRTRVGFVPRTDFRDFHNFISYSFRPEKKFLISWGPEFFVQRLWDYDGTRLDESIEGSLEWQFTGQTHFEVNYLNRRERLRPVDFPILQGDKDFNTNQWVIEFETSFVDEFRVESDVGWGNTINFVPVARQEPHPADMLAAELEVNLQPITPFRIDNDYIFFQLNDEETGDQILKNQILRSRWNWQFNRKLSLRLIFQYDVTQTNSARTRLQSTKNFNVDFLITYLVNPWTALFVGVNSNYQNLALNRVGEMTEITRTGSRFLNDSRQFFVKYSHLIRF